MRITWQNKESEMGVTDSERVGLVLRRLGMEVVGRPIGVPWDKDPDSRSLWFLRLFRRVGDWRRGCQRFGGNKTIKEQPL